MQIGCVEIVDCLFWIVDEEQWVVWCEDLVEDCELQWIGILEFVDQCGWIVCVQCFGKLWMCVQCVIQVCEQIVE